MSRCAIFPGNVSQLPGEAPGTIFGANLSGSQFLGYLLDGADDADVFLPLKDAPEHGHSYSEIPAMFANVGYEFAYSVSPGILHKLRDFRDRYAPKPFPVTSTTHTISYMSALEDLAWLWRAPTAFDGIACISRAAAEATENLLRHAARLVSPDVADGPLPVQLTIIPHGVNTELFRPRDKREARSVLGLPADAGVVLYLGRLSYSDKMDLTPLFRAFRRLTVARPDCKFLLVVAGEDTYGDSLAPMQELTRALGIAGSVRFWGRFDAALAPTLYNAADVFVSPADNLQESFGNTVLESMASGTPVIASDWDGYRDIVVDGETGFLVHTYWTKCDAGLSAASSMSHWQQDHLLLAQSVIVDTGALSDRLVWCFGHPNEVAEIARRGRERAVNEFAWDKVMACYRQWWAELGEIAAKEGRVARPPQTLRHDYYGCFRHYATTDASDLRVRLRPMPPDDPERIVRFPETVSRAVNLEVFPEVLAELGARSGGFIPFADLISIVRSKAKCGEQEATYLCCTLLKQGIFELQTGI